jgi:hypothetical protein
MLLAVFGRKGTGGRVLYGYRVIAQVATWSYAPDPNGKGEGTVEVTLTDVHPAYRNKSDVTLELTGKAGTLRWAQAELMSDTCVVVPGPPQ